MNIFLRRGLNERGGEMTREQLDAVKASGWLGCTEKMHNELIAALEEAWAERDVWSAEAFALDQGVSYWQNRAEQAEAEHDTLLRRIEGGEG